MAVKAKTTRQTKPQVSEKERERRHERFGLVVFTLERVVSRLGVTAGVVVAVYFIFAAPIKYSAGQATSITYLVDFLSNIRVSVWLPSCFAAGFFGWGWGERKLRMRERREKDQRLKELEMKLDPNRSSSQLSVDGNAIQGTSE
jgi:hypothetical protein